MEFAQVITALKSSPGLETLSADNEGIYRIAINDEFIVALASAPDSLDYFLFTTICFVPSEEKVKWRLYEQFLACNLFGKETHRGYFALDNRHGTILLIRQFDTSIESFDAFMKELKDFVNTLVYWQEKLQGSLSKLASQETAKASGNLLFNLERRV